MRTLIAVLVVLAATGAPAQVPSHQTDRPPRAEARVVARVNGVALTQARLDAALGALIPFESFHRNVSPAKLAELRRQALDTIVEEELEYQEGVRLHVVAGDAAIDKEVAALQQRFATRTAFDAALARSDATMSDLRRELRRKLVAGGALRREVTAKCQVTRSDAETFFRSNPDRFVVPEQLHLYTVTVAVEPSASSAEWNTARQRAEAVRDRIDAGEPFRPMATDMGFLHRGALTDEFERAIRNLPVGVPSEIVQSLYGFHIVEVVETKPQGRKAFADVAADLQRDLTSQRCDSMKTSWLRALRARAVVVVATADL
ncbi:MAG TPA: SurA N-terminal domain-containing protein [Vicinamibacterales bacterium]|nr:SurA N-terminal domain-containing protein [Vicinamibacterales bacterium]